MQGLYSQFQTDKELESKGIWIQYGTTKNEAGEEVPVRILIARAGGANQPYQKAIEKAVKPYRTAIQNGTIDPELAESIMREVFAKHVVLSWENIKDAAGNPIPYTQECVVQVLKDLPDLYTDLRTQANNMALFRKEVNEADLKN